MSIRTTCPRCKQPLAIPHKLAGGYVNCPRCEGRFWVNKDAGDGPIQPPAPPPPPPVGALPPVGRPFQAVQDGLEKPSYTGGPPIAPPVQVMPPPSTSRKVAKLVSADSAVSNFTLAADGQLPHLQLDEGEDKPKAEQPARTIHPAVLFTLLAVSVVVSIGVVLWPSSGSAPPASATDKAKARAFIRDNFFGGGALTGGELAPYQIMLREAQQAHSRGDRRIERLYYHKVLELLRAESTGRTKGLTGSHARDKELEQRLVTLLSE